MEEQIKNIIARYIKIPAEQINNATIIDKSAVSGSILLHRMYAGLANEGFVAADYWDIKNFGMLLQRLNKADASVQLQQPKNNYTNTNNILPEDQNFEGIGIDIEEIDAMPLVNDFREDEFYKMNFTAAEISYCILQPNALASFAGLFAAKEAMAKANNDYQNKAFNTIFIDHLPGGKPVHPQFQLSISHTGKLAAAVASNRIASSKTQPSFTGHVQHVQKSSISFTFWVALFALLLSLISIFLLYKH